MSKQQRRKAFVDRDVQGRLAVRVGVYCACFMFSVFLILAGAPLLFLLVAQNPEAPSLYEVLWSASRKTWPIGAATMFMLPFLVQDLMRLSNRFAGPIYRVRSAMKELAEGGQPSDIRFRDGDNWHELADYFNQINERLRKAEAAASQQTVGETESDALEFDPPENLAEELTTA